MNSRRPFTVANPAARPGNSASNSASEISWIRIGGDPSITFSGWAPAITGTAVLPDWIHARIPSAETPATQATVTPSASGED